MLDIKVTKTTAPKAKPDEKHLGFGNHYTDHMFIMDYTEGRGWHSPRIEPYHSLELDPAALVFHYAQECFEGMKAYRAANGRVLLFRPERTPPACRAPIGACAFRKSPWRISYRLSRRSSAWTKTGCPENRTPASICARSPSPPRRIWA